MANNNNTTNQNKKNWKKVGGWAAACVAGAAILSTVMSGSDEQQANVQTANVNANTGSPTQSQDPNYIEQIQQRNASDAQTAFEAGKSHVDIAANKVNDSVNENDFVQAEEKLAASEPATISASEPAPTQTVEQVVEERVIIKEVAVPSVEEYDPLKDVSLIAMFNQNREPKKYTLTNISNREKREALAQQAQEEAKQAATAAATSASDAEAGGEVIIYKVGELIPATLETGINSTRPSIVRARIESGPLAGSILTGNFTQNDTSVTITFTSLNSPLFKKSIPINGLAMDFKTASTALSTSVNRHIPERIALAFAGSFAKGYAEAIKNNNTTVTQQASITGSDTSSSTTSITRPKTIKEINKESAAVAIDETANVIESLVPQRPTVKVRGNMEIGIYLSQDLIVNISEFKDKSAVKKFEN